MKFSMQSGVWALPSAGLSRLIPLFLAAVMTISPSDPVQAANRIGFTGVTRYDPAHIWAYVTGHAASTAGHPDPESIAATIEQLYKEDGFFLASAEVVRDSRGRAVAIAVREGHVRDIAIEGLDARVASQVRAFLDQAVGNGPVRLADFERALALAGDLSGVTIRTEFLDADGAGGARLRVVGQSVRQRGSLTIDNPPRSLGKSGTASLAQEFYSTFTGGDLLRFSLAGNKVFRDNDASLYGGVHYRAPINAYGTYLEFYAGNALARRDFSGNLRDSDQRGRNAIAVLGHPILRDLHQFLFALAEYDYSYARSHAPAQISTSEAHTVRGTLAYSHVFANSATIRTGLTLSAGRADETVVPGVRPINKNFWHVRAGFGWVQPLDSVSTGLATRFEITGQYSPLRLPEVEKVHLGDRQRLRGYRIAEFEGETGFASTFEVSKHFSIGNQFLMAVVPYAFVDFGFIRERATLTAPRNDHVLTSLGAGLKIHARENFSFNSWLAFPLSRGANSKHLSPAAYVSLSKYW